MHCIYTADEFSSELRPKVLHAATLVSGITAAWGTAGCMDEEMAKLCRGQATDDDDDDDDIYIYAT